MIGTDYFLIMGICHSLWGVWVEIRESVALSLAKSCHSLWGVWVEIYVNQGGAINRIVTPFGECGLK